VSLLKYHQNLSKMMDLGGQITRNLIQIDGFLELMVEWLILFSQTKVPQQTYSLCFSSVFFKGHQFQQHAPSISMPTKQGSGLSW
jgi:hypothetical protein